MHSNVEPHIKDLARGRWTHILSSFGIGEEFLRNKHSACPLCGGRDRYRFDDRNGDGTYFCNGCGAGDGISLLQGFKGWGFPTVVREVKNMIGNYDGPIPQAKAKPKPDPYKNIEKLLSDAMPVVEGDQVTEYLKGRGLSTMPGTLLSHSRLYDGETKQNYQGMLGIMEDSEGKIVSVHRTFLKDGKKASISSPKKFMPAIGSINGSAIRLFPIAQHIGVSEGIETAIACHEMFGLPVWATVSVNGMKSFIPPNGVEVITIFADNDANFAGQAAAYDAANKLKIKGFRVEVKIPKKKGFDWLDVLNGPEKT